LYGASPRAANAKDPGEVGVGAGTRVAQMAAASIARPAKMREASRFERLPCIRKIVSDTAPSPTVT
jgi:hypothetical protein